MPSADPGRSGLIEVNRLVLAPTGVWLPVQVPAPDPSSNRFGNIGYMESLFAQSTDFSLHSAQIEQGIQDLEADYLLSSTRSNLLRVLRISGGERVLELGSLCGNVTRYLGELDLRVDAVEADPRLAALAAIRCADQANVTVVNAVFDDLELPKHGYDVILLLGVAEHPQHYFRDVPDQRLGARRLLQWAAGALTSDGAIVVAMNNRLGLKFMLGFPDEHTATAYAGIRNYTDDDTQGRSYSKGELSDMLVNAGVGEMEFCYAFPDYKLPSVIVTDAYLAASRSGYTHLSGVPSRDYCGHTQIGCDEAALWEAFYREGRVGDYANSFLVVAANRPAGVAQRIAGDFAHISCGHRKRRYRVVTIKPSGEPFVRKLSLISDDPSVAKDSWVNQVLQDESYIEGTSLSDQWRRSLQRSPKLSTLLTCFSQYYALLTRYRDFQVGDDELLDLLPRNILVDSAGKHIVIDREWRISGPIDLDYILFRALLYFVNDNRSIVSQVTRDNGICTTKQFIAYCFEHQHVELDDRLPAFIAMENRVQRAIRPTTEYTDTANEIEQLIGAKQFFPHLFWSLRGESCGPHNMRSVTASFGLQRQCIEFNLPEEINQLAIVRFDPAKQIGFFHIHRFTLSYEDEGKNRKRFLEFSDSSQLAEFATLHNIEFGSRYGHDVFYAESANPMFEIFLDGLDQSMIAGGIRINVEMDWPKSQDYMVLHKSIGQALSRIKAEKLRIVAENISQVDTIEHLQRKTAWYQDKLSRFEAETGRLQADLTRIHQSIPWRLLNRLGYYNVKTKR